MGGDIRRFVWTDEDLEPAAEGAVKPGGTILPDPTWRQNAALLRLIWDLSRHMRRGRGRPRMEGRERVLRVTMTEEEWARLDALRRVIYRLTRRRVGEGALLGLIGAHGLEELFSSGRSAAVEPPEAAHEKGRGQGAAPGRRIREESLEKSRIGPPDPPGSGGPDPRKAALSRTRPITKSHG